MMSLRQWLGTTKTYWLLAVSSVALQGPFVWLQLRFTCRILRWRDAIRLKIITMLRRVGDQNRKWQKQNLGGGVVTHRRLAAAEIVEGRLYFNGFHTSALSLSDQELLSGLLSYSIKLLQQSDLVVMYFRSSIHLSGFQVHCKSWRDMGRF